MARLEGGGDSGDDQQSDAEEELSRRDQGSDGGVDGGDVPDSVYDDINNAGSDTSDGDSSGGGSDASEELTERDQGSGGGSSDSGTSDGGQRDRSTDRGVTSGDGETTTGGGDTGESTQQSDAAEELAERDPGSGDGESSQQTDESDAAEELTERDQGSDSQQEEAQTEDEEATAAEQLTARDEGSDSPNDPARPVGPGRVRGGPTSGSPNQDQEELSALAALSVPENRRQEALTGEGRIQARAQQGDDFAELFEAGTDRQEFGSTRARDAERGVELILDADVTQPVVDPLGFATGGRVSVLDAEVGAEGASVQDQLESTAGGVVEFPSLLAGGAAQVAGAGGIAAEQSLDGDSVEADFDDVKQTTATASRRQASLVTDRPVEAALILAPAGPSFARGARRGAARGRARASNSRFLADESGQMQVGGRQSRSSGETSSESVQPSTRRTSPDADPRVFERNRGRGGGRAEPIDPTIGSRQRRTGDTGRFREDVQRFKEIEQSPQRDLRAVDAERVAQQQQSGAGAAEGGAAAGAGLESDADAVVDETRRQEGVELLEEAQQPQAQVDDATPERSVEDLEVSTESDAVSQREVQADAVTELTDTIMRDSTATEPDVTAGTGGASGPRGRGETAQRNRQRTGTTPATDTDTRAAEDVVPDQRTGESTTQTTDATPTTDTPPPGPTPTGRGGGRNRPPRQIPDLPDFPGGGEPKRPPQRRGPVFDREFSNPVAAPDQLDDVAGDILGDVDDRDDRRRRRRRRRGSELGEFDDDLESLDDALEGL